MAVYQTRWFDRWARKQGLAAADACKAVREMAIGLYDAELGGGLVKKRMARAGEGKRGGFRTVVATNRTGQWFFVFGFAKNARSNIDATEEEALKRLATHLLGLSQEALTRARLAGELMEVDCHG